jgi:hypothetical protein
LLLFCRLQFDQRYEFGVGATLASDAKKIIFFHKSDACERYSVMTKLAQRLRSGFRITRRDRDYVMEVAQQDSILDSLPPRTFRVMRLSKRSRLV